jgi:hypothetical protein
VGVQVNAFTNSTPTVFPKSVDYLNVARLRQRAWLNSLNRRYTFADDFRHVADGLPGLWLTQNVFMRWQTNAIDHIGKLEFVSARIIQVRPLRNPRWRKRGAWEVFDAERVSPVYCGENARDSALSYARAEIQMLDEAWNVVEMIGNEEARPLV